MNTITTDTENEIIIKNSKFITLLYKIDNIEDIQQKLDSVKIKYPKATHYCYAYILNQQKHSNDDKEPSGTAGIPILNVLEKEDMNKILAVVVRYFGGIKLGASGLVRAYTKSIKEALKSSKICKLISGKIIDLTFTYSEQKQIDYLLKDSTILNQEFTENIKYRVLIDDNSLNKLIKYNYQIIKSDYIESSK